MKTRNSELVYVDPFILWRLVEVEPEYIRDPVLADLLDLLIRTCLARQGQELVRMRVDERLTYAEIGAAFGHSRAWARDHFHQELGILRDLLEHGPAYGPLAQHRL